MKAEIAIIGAGIGGIYCASLLREIFHKDIYIFEEKDALGGKLISHKGINLGAGRYCPISHIRLNRLIQHLSIPIHSFKYDVLFSLRKKSHSFIEESLAKLYHHKNLKKAYGSFYEEAVSCLGKLNAKHLCISSGYDALNHKDLSFEAGCNILQEHPETYFQKENWYQLENGFQTLPIKLFNTFDPSQYTLFLNSSLKKIIWKDGLYSLTFKQGTSSFLVNSPIVILAMPITHLCNIEILQSEKVDLKKELIPVPLFKCYLCYDNQWYSDELSNKCLIVNNPLRKIYFDSKGNMFFYVDSKSANYWKKFKNKELLFDEIANHLSLSINIEKSKIPYPKDIFYHYWDPGICLWKKDSIFHGKFNHMLQIHENLYICSDLFTEYAGWIEGSLMSAESIIKMIT